MPRGRKPGTPKTGGRTKGTPNKCSVRTREALWDYVESQAAGDAMAHPVRLFTTIMTSPTSSTADRLTAASALFDRMLPKLKAVELSGDPDKPLVLTDATLRQARIAALLAKRGENGHDGPDAG
jgi:hypothetical protein